MIQAASPKRGRVAVLVVAVRKPSASSLSKNAQRKVSPKAMRSTASARVAACQTVGLPGWSVTAPPRRRSWDGGHRHPPHSLDSRLVTPSKFAARADRGVRRVEAGPSSRGRGRQAGNGTRPVQSTPISVLSCRFARPRPTGCGSTSARGCAETSSRASRSRVPDPQVMAYAELAGLPRWRDCGPRWAHWPATRCWGRRDACRWVRSRPRH